MSEFETLLKVLEDDRDEMTRTRALNSKQRNKLDIIGYGITWLSRAIEKSKESKRNGKKEKKD